jgi:molecular chaperone GrpE
MKKDEANDTTLEAPENKAEAASNEQLTPEKIEELKQQAAKAAETWERLLRTTADFDNYKKRMAREKQDAVKFANESLLEKLLPVFDSFEMALTAVKGTDNETGRALQQGLELVFQQFKQTLKDAGLEEIDSAGSVFDPNVHEAVTAMESADTPEGHVLQQLRKGYKLRDRLLRPASVVVAKAPASNNTP